MQATTFFTISWTSHTGGNCQESVLAPVCNDLFLKLHASCKFLATHTFAYIHTPRAFATFHQIVCHFTLTTHRKTCPIGTTPSIHTSFTPFSVTFLQHLYQFLIDIFPPQFVD